MSSSDRLFLILHIGFAIFALGPLTAATMASPRAIRRGDVVVLRYLNRVTRIYGLASLGIFAFGMALAKGNLAKVWLSASMTLFIVALVLLIIVERDQRKAVHLLRDAAGRQNPRNPGPGEEKPDQGEPGGKKAEEGGSGAPEETPKGRHGSAVGPDVASVQRGRIAAISGVVALIWVAILVLMVWNA